jgi:hypothetical protein
MVWPSVQPIDWQFEIFMLRVERGDWNHYHGPASACLTGVAPFIWESSAQCPTGQLARLTNRPLWPTPILSNRDELKLALPLIVLAKTGLALSPRLAEIAREKL